MFMKLLQYVLLVFVSFFLVACTEKLEKVVVSVYPNGTPMQVHYMKTINGKKTIVKETRFFPNAEKSSEGFWSPDNMKEGTWVQWYVTGDKWIEEEYKRDERNGAFTVWQENGEKEYEGQYTANKPSGTWKYYDKKGKKIKEQKFN
jgi:antitoxin component YwqK of YwqJK toxin-antitoxin module